MERETITKEQITELVETGKIRSDEDKAKKKETKEESNDDSDKETKK